jgi:hypothetical protein
MTKNHQTVGKKTGALCAFSCEQLAMNVEGGG